MKNSIVKSSFMATLVASAALASAQSIDVTVNGSPVAFQGAQPQYLNGRVLVPLRGVFEQMGAFVKWDPAARMVYATRGQDDVRLGIGNRQATVNGRGVAMDVPATVMMGRTYVPLRFLGEALGADVRWDNVQRLVAITTSGDTAGRAQPLTAEERRRRREARRTTTANREDVIEAYTVIPVTLNTRLSSTESRRGDRFTANVRTQDNAYGAIPYGSYVEGHVTEVRPQRGDDPGVIELAFDRIRLPNGRSATIDGSLYSLEANAVERNQNGVLVAREKSRDNRTVYAGYGAGAGLIVGLLTKRPLESAALGGVLGYILGTVQKPQNRPSNITLEKGTQFGVRLNQDVAIVRGGARRNDDDQ